MQSLLSNKLVGIFSILSWILGPHFFHSSKFDKNTPQHSYEGPQREREPIPSNPRPLGAPGGPTRPRLRLDPGAEGPSTPPRPTKRRGAAPATRETVFCVITPPVGAPYPHGAQSVLWTLLFGSRGNSYPSFVPAASAVLKLDLTWYPTMDRCIRSSPWPINGEYSKLHEATQRSRQSSLFSQPPTLAVCVLATGTRSHSRALLPFLTPAHSYFIRFFS